MVSESSKKQVIRLLLLQDTLGSKTGTGGCGRQIFPHYTGFKN